MRDLLNQTFGAQFGEVVAEGCQRVKGRVRAESLQSRSVDSGGAKALAGGDVGEPAQGMPDRQLPGMVKFEPGCACRWQEWSVRDVPAFLLPKWRADNVTGSDFLPYAASIK